MSIAAELIGRASSLVPTLRERASEIDRLGRPDDETIRDLVDTELLKTMVPRRFGGFEQDWTVGSKVMEAVASGCGSIGWIMNAYLCTNWTIATFPEDTQSEVYGSKGFVIGPCPMNPRLGRARRVSGGYQVTLTAPFGSGVYHSEWAVLCAMADVEDGEPEENAIPLIMLVPRADYSFDMASWAVLGMRGTGSATLVMKDAFVPSHRAMDLRLVNAGNGPGAKVNTAPMYRVPLVCGFLLMSGGALIGMAKHGLEALETSLRSKVYGFTGQTRGHTVGSQMRLGEVAAYTNAARALVEGDLRSMMDAVTAGTLTIEDRTRFRLNVGYAAMLCRQAIDAVKDTAGASGLRDGNPIQDVYRDLHMISGNFGYQIERTRELYGRLRLDMPIDVDEV